MSADNVTGEFFTRPDSQCEGSFFFIIRSEGIELSLPTSKTIGQMMVIIDDTRRAQIEGVIGKPQRDPVKYCMPTEFEKIVYPLEDE